MSDSDQDRSSNRLLATLDPADYALLAPHFSRVKLDRDLILVTPGHPIEHVYFPEGGIASITSTSDENNVTEIGIFGREGMSGTALLLGSDRTPHETFIQVEGGHAIRIDAGRFMHAVDSSTSLRQPLLRYVQTLHVQTGQSAVANARYQIEARLARWLLMCHDRVDGEEIRLTHEFMGYMIGAQRSGVTMALHILEGSGMIRSKRSRVIILDRRMLEAVAGDSYGLAEAEYRRLIAPFGRTGELSGEAIGVHLGRSPLTDGARG